MAEENKRENSELLEELALEQPAPVEGSAPAGWREIFRQAFEKARREHRPADRSGLGRDRSRALFLLTGAAIAVLLLFFAVFSSPNRARRRANSRPPGAANLGQPVPPGEQARGPAGSPTPLLSAQLGRSDAGGSNGVTAEDVDRTAKPVRASSGSQTRSPRKDAPHALGEIDFSDASPREAAPLAKSESDDLRKASLVFVRGVQNTSASNGARATSGETDEGPALALPTGTKLIARLESVVTSAVKEPVVAAIEYNYERDGEIVVPAGAKAVGTLEQADRSGNVGIRFHSMQMPDGTTEKMEATALSLTYGPLKGTVSGKKTGTNFLLRTFTGLGQAATYLVGAGGLSAPLSESAFLRDRIATNIGIAGDQQLNNLTFNRNIVVTVPGNTRFYIIVEQASPSPPGQAQPASLRQTNSAAPPSMEELRELLQLREEMSAMYQQAGNSQNAAQQVPQR